MSDSILNAIEIKTEMETDAAQLQDENQKGNDLEADYEEEEVEVEEEVYDAIEVDDEEEEDDNPLNLNNFSVNKCQNSTYACSQLSILGEKFCIRHILRDTSGSYTQCAYNFANHKRCLNAISSKTKKRFCHEHSQSTSVSEPSASGDLPSSIKTPGILLDSLTKHLNLSLPAIDYSEENKTNDECFAPEPVNFLDFIMKETKSSKNDFKSAFDSESNPVGKVRFESTYTTQNDDEMSELEDILGSKVFHIFSHGSILTEQELFELSLELLAIKKKIFDDEMFEIFLQFKDRAQKDVLKRKAETTENAPRMRARRNSIFKGPRSDSKFSSTYAALKNYATVEKVGFENHLNKMYKKKLEATKKKNCFQSVKCDALTDAGPCGANRIAYTLYCRNHITLDQYQKPFRICGVKIGTRICEETVCVHLSKTCKHHVTLPRLRKKLQTTVHFQGKAGQSFKELVDRAFSTSNFELFEGHNVELNTNGNFVSENSIFNQTEVMQGPSDHSYIKVENAESASDGENTDSKTNEANSFYVVGGEVNSLAMQEYNSIFSYADGVEQNLISNGTVGNNGILEISSFSSSSDSESTSPEISSSESWSG